MTTPRSLHDAVKNNNVEMVKLLLAAKADRTAKNSENKTPIVMAVEAGYWDLVLELAKYKTSKNDNEKYGYALLLAVEAGQHLEQKD